MQCRELESYLFHPQAVLHLSSLLQVDIYHVRGVGRGRQVGGGGGALRALAGGMPATTHEDTCKMNSYPGAARFPLPEVEYGDGTVCVPRGRGLPPAPRPAPHGSLVTPRGQGEPVGRGRARGGRLGRGRHLHRLEEGAGSEGEAGLRLESAAGGGVTGGRTPGVT